MGPEEIRVLKETFDKGTYCSPPPPTISPLPSKHGHHPSGHNADLWPINNPHIVAALLKVYLRELPNPLLSNGRNCVKHTLITHYPSSLLSIV